jgi:hypothetical protein
MSSCGNGMLLVAGHSPESVDCFSVSFCMYLIMFNHLCRSTHHLRLPFVCCDNIDADGFVPNPIIAAAC